MKTGSQRGEGEGGAIEAGEDRLRVLRGLQAQQVGQI